ncbi:hypothetical protein [Paraburkholderia susongensis]|uniref:Uncharacterized protein n=1 Tax=Paraburkholderia susongensis TaxID=1515439 RepID=A0A1X7J055_9BURK|nr:hypothetical protein [Paraburkholderia susongensis]SMG20967.1 hypothetical protein SAMN06265784_10232 [Paraburkholderia susongensis]
MAIDFKVGAHRSCTLHTRQEYRGNPFSDEARAGRRLITSASAWELTHDTRQLARLVEFMRNAPGGAIASGAAPDQLARMLRAAVERGDVIAVASEPRVSGGSCAPVQQQIRPYYTTVTPSQAFRRALPVARVARSFERPKLPRLPAEDGLAIWFARPGDVLPDGTIATAVSTPLGEAQPFEYSEAAPIDNTEQDAGLFLSPEEETECEMQLNADMDECSVWYAAKPSSWGVCRERSMQRYANCLRGLG